MSTQSSSSHSSHHHRHHHRYKPAGSLNRAPGDRKEMHFKLFKTPKEAIMGAIQATEKKVGFAIDKYIYLCFAAGMYVGIGGLWSLVVTASITNAGLFKLMFGACFAFALALIIFLGGELFTGNCMYFTVGLLQGYVKWHSALFSLVVSYLGNFAGTHFFAFLFCYVTEFLDEEPYRSNLFHIAEHKVSMNFGVTLLRAIPANFLVCSALFFNITAEDLISKFFSIWIPVVAFASIGFEHVIANMFFIPLAIFYGSDITYGEFIYKNLIPATIGNMIGGGVFLGGAMWYLYVCGEDRLPQRPKVPFEFDYKRWTFIPKSMKPHD